MLGDVGGLLSIFISIFSIILTPIVDFFFNIKIFKLLYVIKNQSSNLLMQGTDSKIQISFYEKIVLYINLFVKKNICRKKN